MADPKNLKDVVEHIKVNVNVRDFAEKNYGYKFNNSNMASCLLPEHGNEDISPAFMFYPDSNSWYCHKDKIGGGAIELVARMDDLEPKGESFIEILKKICKSEEIEYDFDKRKPVDPAVEQELERRTVLAVKYRKELWDNKDSRAFQYLLSRGFTEQTIRNFSLGVTAPNESKFGLANISNRIVFPILSSTGKKVIGFSFRTLDDNDSAKYINSATDDIFKKKNIFYGWSHAIETIRKEKHAFVVEGYCDLISMYQLGIKNTLAMMTNRMTEEQIILLAKHVKTVTLILDQDKAGMDGFDNTVIMMLEYGLNVKVVINLGYQKDINDACVKLKWDAKAVRQLINSNAVDAAFYKVDQALAKFDERVLFMREQVLKIATIMTTSIQDENKKHVLQKYVEKRLGL